jgi:hypothetical protein
MSENGYDFIFPTVVAHYKRKDLINPVMKIMQDIPIIEGWEGIASTDDKILDKHPKIQKAFTEEVHGFLKDVMKYPCDLQMTTSWFTKVDANLKLVAHDHNNSWYSACFYIQNDCEIRFDGHASQIYVQPSEELLHNSLSVTYKPEPGSLLIFPSKTLHIITPHNWQHTRYSLAFNFMPKGEVGMFDSRYTY